MSSEFKKEEIVRLIPCGELMVVFDEPKDGRVECIWLDGEWKLNKQSFWPEELEHNMKIVEIDQSELVLANPASSN